MKADAELAIKIIHAGVEGPFFPDWEYSTLMGFRRDEAADLLAHTDWIDLTKEQETLLKNTAVMLLTYPHKKRDILATEYGLRPDDLKSLLSADRFPGLMDDLR